MKFFPHSFPLNTDNAVEIALFRVVQEALSNIAKHSQATKVNILVKESGRFVQIQIYDNGVGFDPATVLQSEDLEKGIGLVSMHERIKLLGGIIEVRSASGQGTSIDVKVPIKRLGRAKTRKKD